MLNVEKFFQKITISLCPRPNSYPQQIWLGTKSYYSALTSVWKLTVISVSMSLLNFPCKISLSCCLISLEKGKDILNMSVYSELLESYALQIAAVREGSNLLMKRRIRPNTVDMKNFRPFFCKGMV